MCYGGSGGGGGGNRLPCVSRDVPMGSHGRESTGVSPERGKSTVAHGKNIAFGDVLLHAVWESANGGEDLA